MFPASSAPMCTWMQRNVPSRQAEPAIPQQAPHAGGCTVLVLAGQRPGTDPVAAHFGVASKALVRVGGEAMLSRVLRTLLATPGIGRILVLAQDVESQLADPQLAWLRGNRRIVPCASGRTISGSVLATLARPDVDWPVLVTTADNVLLSPASVAEIVRAPGSHDAAVALVERRRLEQSCGESRRTWLRFRDGDFTGANLFLLRAPAAAALLRFWESVETDRKAPWKLAARFGPVLLAKVLLRRLSLEEALAAAGRRLQVRVRPVLLTDGRAGVDVDKPADHALAERLLAAAR